MITRAQDFGLWAEILQQAHNLEMYSYHPDMLIDGQVGEIKQLRNGTTTAVDNEIRDASHQRARIVFLQIPANINAPLNKLIETAKRRMARSGTIKKILLYFNGEIKDI